MTFKRALVPLAFALSAILLTFYSEKSPFLGGYGSDGLHYGHYATSLDSAWGYQDIPKRLFERILPIAIVHFTLKAFDISLKPDSFIYLEGKQFYHSENVIYGFMIYNLIIYLIALLLWHKIIIKVTSSIWQYTCSFILLFVNFSNVKQYFFEPVMLDPTTFCFGLGVLYVWLNGSTTKLFLLSLFSMVINIASVFFCLALLAFTRDTVSKSITNDRLSLWPPIFISGTISAICIWNFLFPLCSGFNWENETINYLFPLSLLIVSATLFYFFHHLFSGINILDLKKVVTAFRAVPFILFSISFLIIQNLFTSHAGPRIDYICDEEPYSIFNYALSVFRLAYSRPGGFFASHFAYFGILIPIFVINFKHLATEVKNQGYGAILFLSLSGLLFLNTESRHLLFILPFALYFLLSNLQLKQVNASATIVIFTIAMIVSKIWYPINPLDTNIYPPTKMEDFYLIFEFPLQKYFMNLGPWMSNGMYVLHLFSFLIITWILLLSQRKLLREENK